MTAAAARDQMTKQVRWPPAEAAVARSTTSRGSGPNGVQLQRWIELEV
jgi:hypothetical protein